MKNYIIKLLQLVIVSGVFVSGLGFAACSSKDIHIKQKTVDIVCAGDNSGAKATISSNQITVHYGGGGGSISTYKCSYTDNNAGEIDLTQLLEEPSVAGVNCGFNTCFTFNGNDNSGGDLSKTMTCQFWK